MSVVTRFKENYLLQKDYSESNEACAHYSLASLYELLVSENGSTTTKKRTQTAWRRSNIFARTWYQKHG